MGRTIEGQAEQVEESPEQAADAARLAGMIEEPESAQGEPEAEAPGMSAEESLAGFLSLAGMAAGVAGWPKVAAVWHPEACRGMADRAVPVLVKYPWGARALAFLQEGAGVEELALAMYAAPMVISTIAAVRAEKAEHAEQSEQAKEGTSQQQASRPMPSAGDMQEYRGRDAN